MTNAATYELTTRELEPMDAGDLREHLAAYVSANHFDNYAQNLVWTIAAMIDATTDHVMWSLIEDLQAMGVEI